MTAPPSLVRWASMSRFLASASLTLAVAFCAVPAIHAAPLTNTEVEFDFGSFGKVDVDLFNNVVPTTVNNFLTYVNASAYSNTVIHRMVSGFVAQGGGFTDSDQSKDFSAVTDLTNPLTGIPLEYKIANTAGTLAMARGSSTASATSQWFFNLVNNTTSLGPGGNDPNGYAVFGQVVSGMSTINAIGAAKAGDFSGFGYNPIYAGNFQNLPVTASYTQADYSAQTKPTAAQLITLNTVSLLPAHDAFQNPVLAVDVNHDGTVTALDALVVINDLLSNSDHAAGSLDVGANYNYVDVTGDRDSGTRARWWASRAAHRYCRPARSSQHRAGSRCRHERRRRERLRTASRFHRPNR